MDVGQALLVVAAIVALTEFAKRVIPVNLDSRIVQAISLVIAIGALFLVRETVWAHEQVVGGKPLDDLGVWDTLLAGLLLGGAANVLDRTLKSVANIGENTEANADEPPK